MITDLIVGAIIGCVTSCFLFHYYGLINYELILNLLAGYTKKPWAPPNVEIPNENRVAAEVSRSDNNIMNKNGSKSSQRRKKKVRRSHQLEVKNESDEFPFNSPVMGEKEPLWNHRYSAQLQAAASNLYQAFCEGESDGWSLSSSNASGLQIFRKPKPAGVDMVKGRFLIPYPIDIVMKERALIESRLKFESTTEECKTLLNLGEGAEVGYLLIKSPTRLVSQRDTVTVCGCCLPEKGSNIVITAFTSIIFDACPPKGGKVRANVEWSGWVFEVKSPGSTMATYIVNIDIKGSIPAWIANTTSENAGKTPYNLSVFLKDKYGPYVPRQPKKMKSGFSAPLQEDDERLIYGSEDDMDVSIEESSEESSPPQTELTYTDMQSIPQIPIGKARLSTHQQAEIVTKLNVAIDKVMRLTNSRSKNLWKRTSSTDKGVSIFRRNDGQSGYMGKSIVKFKPYKIWEAVQDPLFRKEYDPMLKSLQVVEEIGGLKVIHMHHQTKNCIAKVRREVLIAFGSKKIANKYVVAATSVEHPACPDDPKMKRVHIGISGWVIEGYRRRPGHSVVTFILDIDFGQVPKKWMSFVNKRQIMTIHDLAIAIKRRENSSI
jgi:hypothetical protein